MAYIMPLRGQGHNYLIDLKDQSLVDLLVEDPHISVQFDGSNWS